MAAKKIIREFGDLIRQRRSKLVLTQQELADKCGLSQPEISALERGRYNPRPRTVIVLEQYLGLRRSEGSSEWAVKFLTLGAADRRQALDFIDFLIARAGEKQ